MSEEQQERARRFAELHKPGEPLILFNAWDVGSAQAVARAGAKAIATGSWSVAAANGFADGEAVPLELALGNAARIAAAVLLPVTIDFERGYGGSEAEIAASVSRLWAAGAVGCNIEDGRDGGSLATPAEQARRLRAAHDAAPAMFTNARVDLFLLSPPEAHNEAMLGEALERAEAYAGAGAAGIFVPGLADEALIGRFCEACPLPVNVMAAPGAPATQRLASLGVARISHGPFPYRQAMAQLEGAARAALA